MFLLIIGILLIIVSLLFYGYGHKMKDAEIDSWDPPEVF